MKITITLFTLAVFVSLAMGQIRLDQAVYISKNDPIFQSLADYQAKIESAYKESLIIQPVFSRWIHVESPAAARLFPSLRFASISWSETPNPAAKAHPVGLAFGIETTLAVNPTTKHIGAVLHANGNYEDFGKMLVDHAIPLRNETDARTIWEAFCELHHRHWENYPAKKVSDLEWRLGLFSYDQTVSATNEFKTEVTRTHYIQVAIDPMTNRISSWKSVMDTSEEWTIPNN